MVGDEWISRSVEFQMTRAAERKEREPHLLPDSVGTRSAGQRSEGNKPVDDSECEKKHIEESL